MKRNIKMIHLLIYRQREKVVHLRKSCRRMKYNFI